MRRRRSSGFGSQRSGLVEVLLGHVVQRGDPPQRVAGPDQPERGDRRRQEGDGDVGPMRREMALEPAPEGAVLAEPEQVVDAGSRRLAARGAAARAAGRARRRRRLRTASRAAQVGVDHAEGERVERRAAARLVADDLHLVAAGGERVGGLDQHPLGAAAAPGEPVDDEADPARRRAARSLLTHRPALRREGPAARARRAGRGSARDRAKAGVIPARCPGPASTPGDRRSQRGRARAAAPPRRDAAAMRRGEPSRRARCARSAAKPGCSGPTSITRRSTRPPGRRRARRRPRRRSSRRGAAAASEARSPDPASPSGSTAGGQGDGVERPCRRPGLRGAQSPSSTASAACAASGAAAEPRRAGRAAPSAARSGRRNCRAAPAAKTSTRRSPAGSSRKSW